MEYSTSSQYRAISRMQEFAHGGNHNPWAQSSPSSPKKMMSRTGSDPALNDDGRRRMKKQLSSPQLMKVNNSNQNSSAMMTMSPKQRSKRHLHGGIRKAGNNNNNNHPSSPPQGPKKRIPSSNVLQSPVRSPPQRPKQRLVVDSGSSVMGPPPSSSPVRRPLSPSKQPKPLAPRPLNELAPWLQSPSCRRQAISCLSPSGDRLAELCRQGFPLGLAQELKQSVLAYPIRFWLIDNSESMGEADGKNAHGLVSCSRFLELQGAVKYQARLAGILRAKTVFRMVNDPAANATGLAQEFSVADLDTTSTIEDDVRNAAVILRQCEPTGDTPLTQQMEMLLHQIRQIAPDLQLKGQKAVVVVATDGMPTDKHGKTTWAARRAFVQTLRAMKKMPVWIVLRLCTDDVQIVKFYNGLDALYKLPLEVMDDFIGEAREVHKANPWLTYAQPLQRCREMGYHHRVFDLLDERLLSMDELYEFLVLLFGKEAMLLVPHPSEDWPGFIRLLHEIVRTEGMHSNLMTRKEMPWIDMEQLEKCYVKRSGFRLFRRSTSGRKL